MCLEFILVQKNSLMCPYISLNHFIFMLIDTSSGYTLLKVDRSPPKVNPRMPHYYKHRPTLCSKLEGNCALLHLANAAPDIEHCTPVI